MVKIKQSRSKYSEIKFEEQNIFSDKEQNIFSKHKNIFNLIIT